MNKNPPPSLEGDFGIYMAVPLRIELRFSALEADVLTAELWDYEIPEPVRNDRNKISLIIICILFYIEYR